MKVVWKVAWGVSTCVSDTEAGAISFIATLESNGNDRGFSCLVVQGGPRDNGPGAFVEKFV